MGDVSGWLVIVAQYAPIFFPSLNDSEFRYVNALSDENPLTLSLSFRPFASRLCYTGILPRKYRPRA